jgi:hypothetical protein
MRIRTTAASIALAAALAAPAASASGGPAAGGGTVTSGPSCAVKCITSALIEPHTGAFGISVHTDTPARIFIGVSTLLAANGPWIDSAQSPAGRTSFADHLTGLAPDTLYKVTVSATDGASRTERHSTFVRTRAVQTTLPEGPGDVLPNVGCSVQCITYSHLAPEGTGLGLTIDTNVPAKTTVSVDRDAPGTIGDAPFFGTPEGTTSGAAYAKRWSGFLKDLVPDRTYHIIIRSTDSSGHSAYRTGLFRTKSRRAKLVLEGIRVYYDGDKGANRGELRFDVAVNQNDEPSLRRKEKTVASGNWVTLGHSGTLQLMPQSRGLNVAVQARERDNAPTCFDPHGTGVISPDHGRIDKRCDKWTWETARGIVDLDAPVPGSGLAPIFGGTGRHEFELITRWDGAGIRYVVYGHVDVRYS